MNAAEDFMLLLIHAHVIAAAEVIQSITNTVVNLAKAIVTNYVRLRRIDGQDVETCSARNNVCYMYRQYFWTNLILFRHLYNFIRHDLRWIVP